DCPCPYALWELGTPLRSRAEPLLKGHDVESIDELPNRLTGWIFSNEFFDALPVHRVVHRAGVLKEIYVKEHFEEIEGELQEPLDAPLEEGQLADINLEARHWIRRIAESVEHGDHLAIDYDYLRDES